MPERPKKKKPPFVVISFHKHLVAVHARTGKRMWTYELGLKADVGRLVVQRDRVLFATSGKLFCLDYMSGEALWVADLPSIVASKPNMLVHVGCILLTAAGETVAFSLKDGSQLWHEKFKGMGIYEGAMAAPGVTAPIDRIQP